MRLLRYQSRLENITINLSFFYRHLSAIILESLQSYVEAK